MWSNIKERWTPAATSDEYNTALANANAALSEWSLLYNQFTALAEAIANSPDVTIQVDEQHIPHKRTLDIFVSRDKKDESEILKPYSHDADIARFLSYTFAPMHEVAKVLKSFLVSKAALKGSGYWRGYETNGVDECGQSEETVIAWIKEWADTEAKMTEQKRLQGELATMISSAEVSLQEFQSTARVDSDSETRGSSRTNEDGPFRKRR